MLYPYEAAAILACIWAAKALGLIKEAKEAELAAAAAADDWAEAKWAKSNLTFSAEVVGTSRLPELVSEGLSSEVVGLLGGECLATAEKAEFSLENSFLAGI